MDPHREHEFRVEVSGIDDSQFYFTKCSSLSVTSNQTEYREADNTQVMPQTLDKFQYDPITLSDGVTDSRGLWDWLIQAASGQVERKNVTIFLPSNDWTAPVSWVLINAWPQKWQGTEWDPTSNQLAIAQLTLVFDDLRQEAP